MFKKLIQYICENVLFDEFNKSYHKGICDERVQQSQDKLTWENYSCNAAIGKSLVHIPNEWQDPTFAIGVSVMVFENIQKQPMLVAKNVLSGTDVILHPRSFYLADEQMVKALLKLDPQERWNLSTGKTFFLNNWNFNKSLGGELTDPELLMKKLKENNFFQ